MTNKDRDEIREILATALSDSLIGRVEQNIMNVLSPKLGALQTKAAEAEAKTETAKVELGRVTSLISEAEKKFQEFKETRIKADQEFEEIKKSKADELAKFNGRIREANEATLAAENHSREAVALAQRTTEKMLASLYAEVDAKRKELEELKKAHEEFKKVVGLG